MPLEIVRNSEAQLGSDVYIGEAVYDKRTETPAEFYREYLESAAGQGIDAIAIPLITDDGRDIPKWRLLDAAVSEIGGFLSSNDDDMTVYLTVEDDDLGAFSDDQLDVRFAGRFADLSEYLEKKNYCGVPQYLPEGARADEPQYAAAPWGAAPQGAAPNAAPQQADRAGAASGAAAGPVQAKKARRRLFEALRSEKRESAEESSAEEYFAGKILKTDEPVEPWTFETAAADEDLERYIRNRESTFQEHLFRLIDRKGLDDVEVYKKANIDRKLFSKIKSNPYYQPSKRTALAFAIALELSLDETKDLLLKAGIALSRSNYFDLIMEYCIERGIYNVYEINCMLFRYDQPLLGA